MTYANQFDYDNATEPELSDYRDSRKFAEFADHVTLELLAGRDCAGMSADIMLVELHMHQEGYSLALQIVSETLTDVQFKEWLNDD